MNQNYSILSEKAKNHPISSYQRADKNAQFQTSNLGVILDTLAQLVPFDENVDSNRHKLGKRAKAKYLTLSFLFKLIELESPLKKSYFQTYYCSNLLIQSENKITSSYCNQRWCLVCNRIRTAKMINGYLKPLKELEDPYFVTLTIPNCSALELNSTINDMQRNFSNLRKWFNKRKMPLKGIRKFECTWNCDCNNFHPHYHFIVDGHDTAGEMVKGWLRRYPTGSPAAQNVKPANDHSIIELFKYFTKLFHTNKSFVTSEALDTMFQAMKGRRVFQPMGGIKKVSEDIDDIKSEIMDDLERQITTWLWHDSDWFDRNDGSELTGYIPTNEDQNFGNSIK